MVEGLKPGDMCIVTRYPFFIVFDSLEKPYPCKASRGHGIWFVLGAFNGTLLVSGPCDKLGYIVDIYKFEMFCDDVIR